ncbi:hypothetical protein ACVIGV_006254 [Rhizobium leguminosarum]
MRMIFFKLLSSKSHRRIDLYGRPHAASIIELLEGYTNR